MTDRRQKLDPFVPTSSTDPTDTLIRLSTHPIHTSAVIATVIGLQTALARAVLTTRGFEA
jgi:hypothetical protein